MGNIERDLRAQIEYHKSNVEHCERHAESDSLDYNIDDEFDMQQFFESALDLHLSEGATKFETDFTLDTAVSSRIRMYLQEMGIYDNFLEEL